MKAVCEDDNDDKKRRFFADSVSAPAVEKSDLSPPNRRRRIPPPPPLLDFHDGPTFGHGTLPGLQPEHDEAVQNLTEPLPGKKKRQENIVLQVNLRHHQSPSFKFRFRFFGPRKLRQTQPSVKHIWLKCQLN